MPVPLTRMLNAWGCNANPSGWGAVPRADPIENMSAQKISMVSHEPPCQSASGGFCPYYTTAEC